MFFKEESTGTLVHLSSTDNERLLRPFYTLKLMLTDDSKIINRKELLKYLFKTYLNIFLLLFIISVFNFFSANKKIMSSFFHYQRCENNKFIFYHYFPISLNSWDDDGNMPQIKRKNNSIHLSVRNAK